MQYKCSDLSECDVCKHCSKDLRTVDEIHVLDGDLFCSEECAVKYTENEILQTARDEAMEHYRDNAEVVTPIEIGLTTEELWTVHDGEITVVFKSTYTDTAPRRLLTTEVTGFYYGAPEKELTEFYNGKRIATHYSTRR